MVAPEDNMLNEPSVEKAQLKSLLDALAAMKQVSIRAEKQWLFIQGLRMWGGSVVRHSSQLPQDTYKKPSIMLFTMPKSGSVFLARSIASSLGYDISRQLVSGGFPKTVINKPVLLDFLRGGMIAQTHMEADKINLDELYDYGVRKVHVHFRDPRAAMNSWHYHLTSRWDQFVEHIANGHELHHQLAFSKNQLALRELGEVDLRQHLLDTQYPYFIDWADGWMRAVKDDKRFEFILTNYDEMVNDQEYLFERIEKFFGVSGKIVPVSTEHVSTFRKGDPSDWRQRYTFDQIAWMTAQISPELRQFLKLTDEANEA